MSGNSSISLVYKTEKVNVVSESLNNINIESEATKNGTKYNIDTKIIKILLIFFCSLLSKSNFTTLRYGLFIYKIFIKKTKFKENNQ
jgi:hypothetical protein